MKASKYIEQFGDFEITEEIEKCIPKSVWDLREGDTCYHHSNDIIILYYDNTSITIPNTVDYGVLYNGNIFYCTKEDGNQIFIPAKNVKFFGRLCDYEDLFHVDQR